MAKNDITLNVGTRFSGDGLKKLDAGMKQAAKGARTASQAMSAISGELGQIGGAAGKATSAISGMMSALAAGGPMALVIGGITAAIGFVVKAFNDAKEAAKEAAQTMRDSFSNAMESTQRKLEGLLKMFGRLKKDADINTSKETTDAEVAASREQMEIQRRHIQARSTMTNEYDIARDKASETRELGMAKSNAKVQQSQIGLDSMKDARANSRQRLYATRQSLNEAREIASRAGAAVDQNIKAHLENFEKSLEDLQKGLAENGRGATAIKRGDKWMGLTAEANIKYGDAVTMAAIALNEFKSQNEDAVKNIEAYNKAQEQVKKLEDQLNDAKAEQRKASADYSNALKKHQLVVEDNALESKRLEETYKEQIASINKQEKNAKDAENKQKQAEENKKKRAEIEGQIADKEKENKVVVDDLKKQGQALAEREKVLSEELKKAEDAAKGMKAGFDAAGEVAKAMAGDGLWQGGVGAQGGVNQWISDNRRAQGEANKEIGRINANKRAAQGQQYQLGKRIFGRNGGLLKTANLADIGRFSEVTDFLGGNGISEKERNTLERQANQLRNRFFDKDGNLKRGINPASRDLQQLKKIEGLLGKFKKLDEVKKKQEELKKVEAEKQKIQANIETNTKNTADKIDELKNDIKKLAM